MARMGGTPVKLLKKVALRSWLAHREFKLALPCRLDAFDMALDWDLREYISCCFGKS